MRLRPGPPALPLASIAGRQTDRSSNGPVHGRAGCLPPGLHTTFTGPFTCLRDLDGEGRAAVGLQGAVPKNPAEADDCGFSPLPSAGQWALRGTTACVQRRRLGTDPKGRKPFLADMSRAVHRLHRRMGQENGGLVDGVDSLSGGRQGALFGVALVAAPLRPGLPRTPLRAGGWTSKRC